MIRVALDGAGGLSVALAAGLASFGWIVDRAAPNHVVILALGDVQASLTRLSLLDAPVVVIVVDESAFPPLETHLLLAAIEPLAIAAAPRGRRCAVAVRANADPADVAAAVDFLLRASSVTGQTIRIDPSARINA